MEQTFENYIKNYNINDPGIKHKYNHSYRVMKNSVYLENKQYFDYANKYLKERIKC